MNEKRAFTESDKAAQERLKDLWDRKGKKVTGTQDQFAKEIGWVQSAVARYLNGHAALNRNAVLEFAKKLRVQPEEIYPELFASLPVQLVEDDELYAIIKTLTKEQKKAIQDMAVAFSKGVACCILITFGNFIGDWGGTVLSQIDVI